GGLTVTTILFADEVRPTKDVDAATAKAHKPTAKQLNAAVSVIEALAVEWDPDKNKARYRDRLSKVVDRKRKAATIEIHEPREEPEPAPDLMEALERTLAEISG